MITLTRRQARALRDVLARPVLGIAHARPVPPLVLHAAGGRLRVRHHHAALAVEHTTRCECRAEDTVLLPLDALAEFAGPDRSPVVLEAVAPGRTVARWDVLGVPQARGFAVPPPDAMAAFPDPPPAWSDVPSGLLDALAEASATGASGAASPWPAADGILLRGGEAGPEVEVIASDGRQILIQGGFGLA